MKDGQRYDFSDWCIGDDGRDMAEAAITKIVRAHLKWAFDEMYDCGEWVDSASFLGRILWFPKDSELFPDEFPGGLFFGPSDLLRVFRAALRNDYMDDTTAPQFIAKWRKAVSLMERALAASEHQAAKTAPGTSETSEE